MFNAIIPFENVYAYRAWGSSLASKYKKGITAGRALFFILAGLTLFTAAINQLLKGKNIALLNSKGLVAAQERELLIFAIGVTVAIALPTVLLLYFTAWRYRESNHKKTHEPTAEQKGKLFVLTAWGLPTLFILVLAFTLVPQTYKLAPQNAVASGVRPITIEVIAMRWKWLFIYPDQHVATVNFVQIPKDKPVVFELTADDAPMSSFWVPNLSGQLYAMTGHVNRLNLMADKEGGYPGRSAEINGKGFEGMKFMARVSSEDDFKSWLKDVRSYSDPLDKASYDNLLKPSENNQIALYTVEDNSLYAAVLKKYAGSHHHSMPASESSDMNSSMKMDSSMHMDMSGGGNQ